MKTKWQIQSDIKQLCEDELKRSYEKFSNFNSHHEGYAVIKEEVDEANEELEYITKETEFLWLEVRGNNSRVCISRARMLKNRAEKLVYEAIQVAAMTQKYIDSLDKKDV
jgi:hypothetical protein